MGERDNKQNSVPMEVLLREQTESALDTLAPRFEAFTQDVLARLDDDVPPEFERVLRVDTANEQELGDAELMNDETFASVRAALVAEVDAQVQAVDWAAFGQGIEDGLQGEATADAVGALLREESEAAAADLNWAAFGQGIEDGLQGEATADAVGALLREESEAEAADLNWAAFGQGIEDGLQCEATADAVGALLREESEAEAADLNWAAFGEGIMHGLEAEEAAPALGAALRERVQEAVAAREGDWDEFGAGVMARLPAQSVTVSELLTEAMDVELASREGEWNAFGARVFEAVDAEIQSAARSPLEVQAVLQMKEEVVAEVEALSPAFGEDFKKSVESEIFKSAQQPAPWGSRAWARFKAWIWPEAGMSPGWAAAAVAAVVLVSVTGLPPGDSGNGLQVVAPSAAGMVAVEQISFEGDVTVMPEEGITVVWLDAPT